MVLGQGISRLSSSQGLRDSVDLFLLNRRVENCSRETLVTYEQRVRSFLRFANKQPQEILKSDIELYLLSLQDKGRSPHYVKSSYRMLQVFFSWMVLEGLISSSPIRNMKPPKVPKNEGKEFISEEQFQKLLSVCADNFCGTRNKAWLWLLWSTGARLSELARLRLADLDWQEGSITVVGKGNKIRQVPFTRPAQRAVYRYLSVRKSYLKDDHFPELWISEERKPIRKGGLIHASQETYFRAGFKVRDLHHVFRRSWAWRNLKSGMSPKFVQLIGGWESMTMLELYVKKMTCQDALKADWR